MKTIIKHYKRALLTRLITGGTIATVLLFIFKITKYFQGNEIWAAIITVILSLLPLIFDLLTLLSYNRKYGMIREMNDLFDLLQEVKNKPNKFIVKSAIHRVQKEKQTIKDFLDDKISLPALNNYEYIREIFRRVLEDIMEKGDSYYTLSNIEFWTKEPFEYTALQKFVERNVQVANNKGCQIIRLIMIHRNRMPSNISSLNNLNEEQLLLKRLIEEFSKSKLIQAKQLSLNTSIQTLFYISDHTGEFDEPVPYGMTVSKNLRDIMLIKPHGLNDKLQRKVNPKIEIKYHSFSSKIKSLSNRPTDVLTAINNESINDSEAKKIELHLLSERINEKLILNDAKFDKSGKKIKETIEDLLNPNSSKSRLLDLEDMKRIYGI